MSIFRELLSQIETEFTKLTNEVNTLTSKVNDLEGAKGELDSKVAELSTSNSSLKEQVTRFEETTTILNTELTDIKASAGDVSGLNDQIKKLTLDNEGYETTLGVITTVFENISESIIILLALAQMPDNSATKEILAEKTSLAPVIVGRHVGILQEKGAVSVQGDSIILSV
jgi:chromosome segregation ATPase